MSVVICKDLVKRFGDSLAVDHVNVEIQDGEFMVFVGPSGCGKTTTLRMIAGLETITSGEIRIDDKLVNDVAPRHRDIAMVFQNYALYPHYKVRDNIGYPLRRRRVPKAEIDKRVHEVAAMLDVERLLDRWPRQLSGGERQRVALGRAIIRNPSVFLMDEPLSNLDAKLRVQMRREIIRLQRVLGTTTIYVTHDQVEAMTMGDRIMVLRFGRIQQVGPPEVTLQFARQHVRRRLHRQPRDERLPRPAGRGRGRPDARHPQRPAPAAAADRRPTARRWRRRAARARSCGASARRTSGWARRPRPAEMASICAPRSTWSKAWDRTPTSASRSAAIISSPAPRPTPAPPKTKR